MYSGQTDSVVVLSLFFKQFFLMICIYSFGKLQTKSHMIEKDVAAAQLRNQKLKAGLMSIDAPPPLLLIGTRRAGNSRRCLRVRATRYEEALTPRAQTVRTEIQQNAKPKTDTSATCSHTTIGRLKSSIWAQIKFILRGHMLIQTGFACLT